MASLEWWAYMLSRPWQDVSSRIHPVAKPPPAGIDATNRNLDQSRETVLGAVGDLTTTVTDSLDRTRETIVDAIARGTHEVKQSLGSATAKIAGQLESVRLDVMDTVETATKVVVGELRVVSRQMSTQIESAKNEVPIIVPLTAHVTLRPIPAPNPGVPSGRILRWPTWTMQRHSLQG